MKQSTSILLFFIFLSITLITLLSVIEIFPHDRDIEDRDELDNGEEDLNTHSFYNDISNGYISTPPIYLDKDTAAHIASFHDEANRLAKKYPDVFLTCNNKSKPVVALTFDDGPDNITTPKILNILDDYNIPATFFLVGQNIEKFPHIYEKIVRSRHQAANHSFSHVRPTAISVEKALDEFERCSTLLDNPENYGIKYIRPPYGMVTEDQLLTLKDRDFKVIGWSIDSMDWYTDDKDQIIKCVVDAIHPGAIVLMHSTGGGNNREATVNALPTIIEALKNQGYSFVTIEDLLEND